MPFHPMCDWCTSPYPKLEVEDYPGLVFCDESCYHSWQNSQWLGNEVQASPYAGYPYPYPDPDWDDPDDIVGVPV